MKLFAGLTIVTMASASITQCLFSSAVSGMSTAKAAIPAGVSKFRNGDVGVANAATSVGQKAVELAKANPITTAATGVVLVTVAAPGIVTVPILNAAGFGAQGVVANTAAAGAQSVIGNVASGSLFATLQSAGMAGYGLSIVNGAAQAVVGGAAAAATIIKAKL